MGLSIIGFIIFIVCIQLLMACKIMTRIRNSVQRSVKQNKHKQQNQLEDKMHEMLNICPKRVL